MIRHILAATTCLAATSCSKSKSSTTPRPAAQTVTEAPLPITTEPLATTIVSTSDSTTASPLPTTAVDVPAAWTNIATPEARATAINALYRLASNFDIQFRELNDAELSPPEIQAETCARKVLGSIKIQSEQNQFTIQATEDFKACMDAGTKYDGTSYNFAHNLKTDCAGVDFNQFNGQALVSQQVQSGFCRLATKADLFFNVTVSIEQKNALLNRSYKRIKALQSSQGGSCTYTTDGGVRTWQDCQWIDRADRNGTGLKYARIVYNGAKATLTESGMTLSEGTLNINLDQWSGQITLGANPTWQLSQGKLTEQGNLVP